MYRADLERATSGHGYAPFFSSGQRAGTGMSHFLAPGNGLARVLIFQKRAGKRAINKIRSGPKSQRMTARAIINILDIPKKISHVFRYLTWSQIPVKTSIWHILRKKPKSLEPLAYERIAIVFQPTARASPAYTKTNQRCVDRLEALEIWFLAQCVPNGCLHWNLTSC